MTDNDRATGADGRDVLDDMFGPLDQEQDPDVFFRHSPVNRYWKSSATEELTTEHGARYVSGLSIYDEIFANFRAARTPEWRVALARRHGVEEALTDSATIALVDRLIRTGAEYERTSERFEHGIRSTPTMIINNRMIIGTFPLEQLRAIFQALVDEHERGEDRFLENWIEN